jgi:hypothetical protein
MSMARLLWTREANSSLRIEKDSSRLHYEKVGLRQMPAGLWHTG